MSMHYANKYKWAINSWDRFPHIERYIDTTLHDKSLSVTLCHVQIIWQVRLWSISTSLAITRDGLYSDLPRRDISEKWGKLIYLIWLENHWPSSNWCYRAHHTIGILNTSAYLNTFCMNTILLIWCLSIHLSNWCVVLMEVKIIIERV